MMGVNRLPSTRACSIAIMLALAAGACAADLPGEVLVTNGSAEQGAVGETPPFWRPVADDGDKEAEGGFPFKTVSDGHDSAKAIMIDKPKGCPLVHIEQSVSLELTEPMHYRYSVWLRGGRAMPDSADLFINASAPGVTLGWTREMFLDVGKEWAQHSLDFYTPAAFDADGKPLLLDARLCIQLRENGPLYIDDVSFRRLDVSPQETAQIESLKKVLNMPGVVKAPFSVMGGIIPGPNGTLRAFTADYRLRHSTDGGVTWGAGEKLAIDDPFDRLSGAILMRNGDIGIWSVSGRKPLYFWRSADGGKTWSKRIPVGPAGAAYHGNAMIEMRSEATGTPLGWYISVTPVDDKKDSAQTESTFETVSGGVVGAGAAALTLAEGDKAMYGATRMTLDRKIAADDQYRYRVKVRADQKARFCLYVEAWNHQANKGSKTREYFNATPDWETYEVTLVTSQDAAGLDGFRVTVQLYTPGAQLLFDDVKIDRVAPAPKEIAVTNASFEHAPSGRLILPVRQFWNAHAGIYEPAGAYGTINGKRMKIEGHAHDPEMELAYVHYSDDSGRTWQRSECDIMIWKDDGLGGIWACDEPNVAQLKDGRLLMLVRTVLGRLYQCFSTDDGRRWSQPVPTELPTSTSPCSLERVPENEYTLKTGRAGDLLIAWNNVSREETRKGLRRARLCSAVSRDDGKTWEHVRTIAAIGVPPLDEMAQLDPPGMTRADKDIGELPMPFGTAGYPDITVHGDSVLVQYYLAFKRPSMSGGGRLFIRPLDWFYGEE